MGMLPTLIGVKLRNGSRKKSWQKIWKGKLIKEIGNFSPWMGFGLYKETIGDILKTFFISAKLNFKKVEIILHVLFNLQLCHSPSKTYKTLSSISFTTKNWNWFEFGSYCIGPGYSGRRYRWCKFPIKTVLKSKFPTTIFEMDQPCHHVASYQRLYDWHFVVEIPIGLRWANFVLRILPYGTQLRPAADKRWQWDLHTFTIRDIFYEQKRR